MFTIEELIKLYNKPEEAIVPLRVRSHPEWQGKRLGEIAQEPDGARFIEALGLGQISAPFHLKLAAAFLLVRKAKAKARTKQTPSRSLSLGTAFKIVKAFCAPRSTFPALPGVHLRSEGGNLVLEATNLGAYIRIELPNQIGEEVDVVIAPQEKIEAIEAVNGRLYGLWGERKFLLEEIADPDTCPPFPPSMPPQGTVEGFVEALTTAAQAVLTPQRTIVEDVYVWGEGDRVKVYGTDGCHLVAFTLPGRGPQAKVKVPARVASTLRVLQGLGPWEVSVSSEHLYLRHENVQVWICVAEADNVLRQIEMVAEEGGWMKIADIDYHSLRDLAGAHKGGTIVIMGHEGKVKALPFDEGKNIYTSSPLIIGEGAEKNVVVGVAAHYLTHKLPPKASLYVKPCEGEQGLYILRFVFPNVTLTIMPLAKTYPVQFVRDIDYDSRKVIVHRLGEEFSCPIPLTEEEIASLKRKAIETIRKEPGYGGAHFEGLRLIVKENTQAPPWMRYEFSAKAIELWRQMLCEEIEKRL